MKLRTALIPRLGLAVVVLVTAPVPLVRGAVTPVSPDLTVQSWDSEDGLTTGKGSFALARTTDGYLWIGSEIGLVRFDDPLNNANSAFTYASWVYTLVGFPSGSVGEMLLSKFSANTSAGCEFKILLRSGDLQFITISGASSQVTAQTALLSTVGATTAGAWNHVAVTAFKPTSGTVTWGCYINGTPIGVTGATQNISTSAGAVSMNLGMTAGGNLNFAPNGVLVDEIRFYDGVLSQQEIISLVPEPSALAMLAMGGGLLLLIRRRR